MIVERNTFYLKFGKARDAMAAIKDMMADAKGMGETRLLTDISGDSYRIILEIYANDLGDLEKRMRDMPNPEKWRAKYEKFIPLCERAYREYLNVVA